MLSKLQFLVKSTNQHGVHSPFVYNYITKGLYENKKKSFKANKIQQWLQQSINYFNPNSICFLNDELSIITEKISTKENIAFKTADLIVALYTSENHICILQTIKSMNNSQLLLIASYSSYPKSFFNELRNNPEITLVVDFYYGCLISKRTEQPKQNFYIRF